MNLGKNIKRLRELAGIALEPMAEQMGLERAAGRQRIHTLEKRESKKSDIAPALANYFEISLDRLLMDDLSGISMEDWESLKKEHASALAQSKKSGSNLPLFADMEKSKLGKLSDGRPIMNIRPVLEWDNESELGEEYVLIPRLDIKVSAGNGRIVWEVDEKGQKQAFRKSWVARLGIDPGQAATVVADGSSMEPRIIDGDSLIVDYKATRLVDGKIYVLAYQNEVYVKRLFKKPGGGLTIRSDNPDKARYPDMDVLPEHTEHVQIIARVVGLSGTL